MNERGAKRNRLLSVRRFPATGLPTGHVARVGHVHRQGDAKIRVIRLISYYYFSKA